MEKTRRNHPVIWVIGATRSCKTAVATNGIAPLGYKVISTGDFFRDRYSKPDTLSREFVFALSQFSANLLSADPDCHKDQLEEEIKSGPGACVVEGERNPIEFSKLYDPKQDMVIFLDRLDVEKYDTVIERGIACIEQNVRWCVSTGISPQDSVFKMTFGLDRISACYFGTNNEQDAVFLEGTVKPRTLEGPIEDRYPWINILIGCVRERIGAYYLPSIPRLEPSQQQFRPS